MVQYAKDYTIDELVVATTARNIKDRDMFFQVPGVPIAMAAAQLARLTHAPNMAYMCGWVLDPLFYYLPEGGAYPDTLLDDGLNVYTWAQTWPMAVRGKMDVFCTVPGQIDKYGNVNASAIGDPDHPKVRLPGGAALPDGMAYSKKVIINVPRHERRVFVEKVDYVTGQGHLPGGIKARLELGLPGRGDDKAISNLAVMGFDENTGLMRLETVHAGVSVEDVRANTGFDLVIPKRVPETEPPTVEQVEIIRTKIDFKGTLKALFRAIDRK